MIVQRAKIKAFWAAALLPAFVFSAEMQPQDILKKVEEALNAAKSVKLDFEETYEWKQTGEKQSISGELILSGQDKFRVTTQDQIIVSDGVTLWTYSKPSNRVLIDRVEKTDDAVLPRQLFFGFKKEYQVKLLKDATVFETPCWVLIFTADKKDIFISQIKAWIEKENWIPRIIEQIDVSKNKTTYILKNVQTGTLTEPDLFQFVIPEGAEVIRL
jgi:outer membrane lipoprotein-sorting protein